MHPNTLKVLADLKAMNIDVSSIETQLNSNSSADIYLGTGLTRTQEFSRLMTDKVKIENELTKAKTDLAALQTIANNPNNGLDAAAITLLNTKIEALESFLIAEDYPEEQARGIFSDVKPLLASAQKPTIPNSPSKTVPSQESQAGKQMTEEERQQLENRAASMGAALGVGLQMQILKTHAEFQSLYGRFPNIQEMAQLEQAMAARTLQTGEAVDAVAADIFKFNDKRVELATADLTAKLEAAKAEGRNEVLQQHPEIAARQPRGARSAAPIARHFGDNKSASTIPGARVVASGNVQIPPPNPQTPVIQNPADPNAALRDANGLLPFQTRGDKGSRLQHLAAVSAARPELFEDNGYQPVYGTSTENTGT